MYETIAKRNTHCYICGEKIIKSERALGLLEGHRTKYCHYGEISESGYVSSHAKEMLRLRYATLERLAAPNAGKELSRQDYARYKRLVKNVHDATALVEIWAARCPAHVPWFAKGAAYSMVTKRFGVKT